MNRLMNMEQFISHHIKASALAVSSLSPSRLAGLIAGIDETSKNGGTVWTCGNGGCAAIAAHLAVGLNYSKTQQYRRLIRAFSLSADVAVITGLANDHGYSSVFARQLKHLGKQGDLLVVISVSGKSASAIAVAECARHCGISIAALVGSEHSKLAASAQYFVPLGSTNPPVAEDAALTAVHAIYSWFKRVKK